MKTTMIAAALLGACAFAAAKIPAPVLDDAAKAKAAEAAAKTAWSGKMEAYLLCKYQDKVAAYYMKSARSAGKDVKPATATPACADPGAFVYPAAGAPMAAAPAKPGAAAPAKAAPAAKKS